MKIEARIFEGRCPSCSAELTALKLPDTAFCPYCGKRLKEQAAEPEIEPVISDSAPEPRPVEQPQAIPPEAPS